MKKPIIILTGPTGVGKTKLSIALAKAVNGSIISADSMQVYRYMDIGSAKITEKEMDGIDHYLVDKFNPDEEFHVVKFQQEAKKAVDLILAQGKIPIVVGGTGFYIQALLYDIDFSEGNMDLDYRKSLELMAHEKGEAFLHQMLEEVDPVSAKDIHTNNVKKVIRALEYYHSTKTPISEHNKREKQKESPYQFAYFVLTDERERLYQNIDLRVDQMLHQGLLDEVKKLQEKGYRREMVSMQGLGYKELLDYLHGEITYNEAIYKIKRDTRHFAKRQVTWYKREREVVWISKKEFHYCEDELLEEIMKVLLEKGIKLNVSRKI